MVHLFTIGLDQAKSGFGLLAKGSSEDGLAGWSELVKGVQKTLDHNASLMGPVIGVAVLAVVVGLADWKLASWCARFWERHHRS